MIKQFNSLDELIDYKGVKVKHVAKALQVTAPTLRKIRKDPNLLTVAQGVKMAEVLDVDIQVIVDTALKQIHNKNN